jgi:hypothetical protein
MKNNIGIKSVTEKTRFESEYELHIPIFSTR